MCHTKEKHHNKHKYKVSSRIPSGTEAMVGTLFQFVDVIELLISTDFDKIHGTVNFPKHNAPAVDSFLVFSYFVVLEAASKVGTKRDRCIRLETSFLIRYTNAFYIVFY